MTQQLDSISPSPAHGSGAVVTTMVRWCDQVRVCHVRCPRCGRGDLREKGRRPRSAPGSGTRSFSVRELQGAFGRAGTFGEGAERRDCPQEALESELLAKMETLKSVHESWMLDQDFIARRTLQERGAITDPFYTFKDADCSVCR